MADTLLPSIRSQTIAPDRWLILCDIESPRWFKEAIVDLTRSVGEPVWIDEFSPSAVSELVDERCSSPWLISTRIDNDDCISRDYIKCIQDEFNGKAEFLNFTYGFQYENGWIYHRSDVSNAFISYCEPALSRPRTVFLDGHHLLKNHGAIRQVRSGAMWMQVVHGGNIANRVNGIRAHPKAVASFDISLSFRTIPEYKLTLLRLLDTGRLGFRVMLSPHRLVWLWKTFIGK
jgi:hypothetical protein